MDRSKTMEPLRDLPGATPIWVQRGKRRRAYELRSGERTFATLEWNSSFGSLATGVCTDGSFTFKRAGFLQPFVTIRQVPSETDLARLYMGFGWTGALTFADGRRYDFRRYGFWSPEWTFVDPKGQGVCRFAPTAHFLRKECQVMFDVDPQSNPDLTLLAILGWYVILLQLEEAAGATAATAGTIAAMG